MLAYLILAKVIMCGGPYTILAADERGVPVLVASDQINQLPNLRAIKHFREIRWPPIDPETGKARLPQKPASFFETTDVYKVWYIPQSLPLIAQATKDPLGLSPEDRKRYDEHLRNADHSLLIGYIAAGTGVACIVVGAVHHDLSRLQAEAEIVRQLARRANRITPSNRGGPLSRFSWTYCPMRASLC